jgi:FkbM family methyltransferase
MLRSRLKRMLRRLGYDVHHYRPDSSAEARFMTMLAHHRINLVFDVGANVGQFAKSLREDGYAGRIVSFEPVSASWDKLVEASSGDPLWEVAPRCAIGEEDGEVEMHVSKNTVSSSILGMLDTHLEAAPDSAYVREEITPLRRLDTLAPEYLRPDSNLFIKIDTQGYESQVLRGAQQLLDRAVGIHAELSLAPIYEGQSLYDELIAYLAARGFAMWDMNPSFGNMQTGRLLCIDATLFRCSPGNPGEFGPSGKANRSHCVHDA